MYMYLERSEEFLPRSILFSYKVRYYCLLASNKNCVFFKLKM